MRLIAGVDEAGKGPVVGPMCVACVAVEEGILPKLEELGLRDSKRISRQRREKLALEIRAISSWYILRVEAYQIDELRKVMTMNDIVLRAHAKVIDELAPDVVFVDASDVDAGRFGRRLAELLECRPRIISEHRADAKYPIVSAASIIAKVARDEALQDIERSIGRVVGSGYPSDQRTRAFLEEALQAQNEEEMRVIRHSWKTAEEITRRLHP
ncbi:MAG TPA: ribonuclease HII [Candidatus Syntrophoarchaeum butanivorans]|uniref:Ribonuclease HII n=1 Tax=Candidatus Syntropharchaeum butanivorans TaxID=1839936 RepID=A0A1F2P2W1_9EURY|nr:MAG: Ribonuclease H2, subunit A [Candidatus Syntrophoarchaeum butanivorans]HEC56287.1 ribonuclease HII [Candidatus Syntrophoarchaeum butanivorans]